MKQLIAILILLSLAAPVRAQLPSGFEPVEKDLIQKQLEQDLNRDFQKERRTEQPKAEAKQGSSWWKWTLGILLVSGIAAAAGGGGGGDSGGGDSGGGGGRRRWAGAAEQAAAPVQPLSFGKDTESSSKQILSLRGTEL